MVVTILLLFDIMEIANNIKELYEGFIGYELVIDNSLNNIEIEMLIISLVIVFLLIILSPVLSNKIRLPVIVIELIFGIIIGKSLLNIVPMHPVIDFLSSFGLIYLMFLVGLEINLSEIKECLSKTLSIALLSIMVPFLSGITISSHVNTQPLILGTIFTTTSLGIILPLTRELKYKAIFNQILLASVAIVDVISIFLLAFSLSIIQGSIEASFFYSLLAILVLFLIPTLINRVCGGHLRKRIVDWMGRDHHFELGVRLAFGLIVTLAAVSYKLGFHSIIGAFIAGLIISEIIPEASLLEKKLESFGYGFFIPLFFIIMGAKANIPLLFSNITNINLFIIIIVIALISKIFGVFLASRSVGFDLRESISLGLFHSARVSLIIAAAEIGINMGLIDENLFSTFIILAVISALFGPSIGKYLLSNRIYLK